LDTLDAITDVYFWCLAVPWYFTRRWPHSLYIWSSIAFCRTDHFISDIQIEQSQRRTHLRLNIMIITTQLLVKSTLCQFNQHFTCEFFVQKCFMQLFSNDVFASYFLCKNIGTKGEHKMLDDIDTISTVMESRRSFN